MQFSRFILPAFLLMASCNNGTVESVKTETEMTAHNTLTASQREEGWELLFNGASLEGWHSYGRLAPGSAWKVQDSSIFLDTSVKEGWQVKDGGDLVTDAEFEDFHLKLEWKVAPKGNSGIIFYVKEDTAAYEHSWHTGPEMQVLDNAGHSDASIEKHRAGDLYDLIASSKDMVKPAGEWNQVEIKSADGRLEFFLNGEQIISTTLWDDQWKEMIANSKFRDMPGFGKFQKGHIVLQDHGDNVWFRNVMIRRL